MGNNEPKDEKLVSALVSGETTAVKDLLASDANVDAATPENMSALMLAVWLGQKYIVSASKRSKNKHTR